MKLNTKDQGVWFTSDIHFGHKNILKFNADTRDGSDTDEMAEIIIANWNEVVQKDDIVFILGDVSFANPVITWEWIYRLNGNLKWITGNHDSHLLRSKEIKCLFQSVLPYQEVYVDGIRVCMCHYPISEWNQSHRGSYMLHGHCHGRFQGEGRIMDVGIDNRKDKLMRPFSWQEIHNDLSQRPIVARYGD